ncbi:MAG: hypothetical protein JNL58_11660 [Planctomyces sp.]|nr:hypothetical protein [Planctomyces sp.]
MRWFQELLRSGFQGQSSAQRRRAHRLFSQQCSSEVLESRELLTIEAALVRDISAGSSSSSPQSPVNVNGTIFFSAGDAAGGTELWKSDGSTTGTVRVKDIFPGVSHSNPRFLTNVNGTLFFTARSTSGTDFELWKSDGTSVGTTLVKDIRVGSTGSDPRYLTNVNGTLYFRANDGVNGYELWKSDGTSVGTVMVKDINSGSYSSNPSYLTNVGGTLYFRALDGNGSELWKTDGTSANTTLVKDIRPGATGSQPRELVNANGTLLFFAGNELWKSDGTNVGTEMVSALTGATSSSGLTVVGSDVFFRSSTAGTGAELWTSDGTFAGTTIVADIAAGTTGSNPTQLTNIGGTLYFTANDGVHGEELWKSNGTSAGTSLVRDVNPGAGSGQVTSLYNHNGTLYFSGNDGTTGAELWSSDGTSPGTSLIEDISVGVSSSSPAQFVSNGSTLYFAATNAATGRELWSAFDNQAPVISAPAAVTISQRPTISWSPRAGAVSYEVWIGNQSTGVNPFLKADSTSSNYTPSIDLGIGRFNVWVRSVFADGSKSTWSAQYSFRIATAVVISPMSFNQVTPTPTISWTAIAGAVRYDIWIDNRTTGQEQFIRNSAVTGTSWTSPSNLPIGQYRVWMRAIDASGLAGNWSSSVDFSVVAAPTPESPLFSTFNRRPTFSWSLVAGAVTYDFVLRNRNTGVNVYSESGLSGRTFAPDEDLPDGPYRWWVIARSATGFVSQTSDPVNFYVGGRPDLLSPSGTASSSTPTFVWTQVTVAISYDLQVDRIDVSTSKIINQSGILLNSFSTTTALPAGTYRAWVRAVSNTNEKSPWSAPVDFTIASESVVDDVLTAWLEEHCDDQQDEGNRNSGSRIHATPAQVSHAQATPTQTETSTTEREIDRLYSMITSESGVQMVPIMAEVQESAYTSQVI